MKNIIVLLFVLMMVSCKKQAVETHVNGEFKIEFLFEHDGCKVYRFFDDRAVYFSDCRGKIEHTTTTHAGKTHITHHHQTMNN